MLRKIRIALAALFFVAITLLFLDFTGAMHLYLGWLAKVQLLPAILAGNAVAIVIMLLLTLLLGRVYCSVICPLGVMQDCFSWLGGKVKKNRFHYAQPHNWLRYIVLGVFILLMIFGINALAILIAPYSAYGRIATNLLQPVYIWINNIFAYFAQRADSYAFYHVDVWVKGIATLVVSAVTFVVIGFLSFRYGRLWCSTICPVGSLLGLVSRLSIFRPVIDTEKCNGCTRCARNCKSMCINPENHTIDYSRCVACMDCLDNCSQGAIKLGRRGEKLSVDGVDSSRRKFLITTAAVGTATALYAEEQKVDGGLAVLQDKQVPQRTIPLKPFGSKDLKNFSSRCTACQLCVSECPSRLLRPSSKLETLMQPELGYENGYCRPSCTRCSDVCPAGAIRPITVEEKSNISIGHAIVLQQNCLSARGEACGMCASKCPAAAISMVHDASTGHVVPAVNESRCIGCGACEYYCPARPVGAIFVEGREVHTEVL